jgi:hypothetical protein
MMKRIEYILVIFTVVVTVFSTSVSSIEISTLDNNVKATNYETYNCGELKIEGDPSDSSHTFYANAVNNFDIDVLYGKTVTLEVDYYIHALGSCDQEHIRISCNGKEATKDFEDDQNKIHTPTTDGPLKINVYMEPDETYEVEIWIRWTDDKDGILPFYDREEVPGSPKSDTVKISTYNSEANPTMGDVAIIVEAGFNDRLQYSFDKTADYAEKVFRDDLGYGEHLVKRLKKPTKSEFRSAIREMAKKLAITTRGGRANIFIYVINHGVGKSVWNDIFDILPTREGAVVLNTNQDLLLWSDLGGWLQEIREDDNFPTYNTCTIVIEACFSGEWIRTASSLQRDNHIIITSTDYDHVAWANPDGYALFSGAFFDELNGETSYGKAWEVADRYVYEEMQNLYNTPISRDTNNNNFFKEIINRFLDSNVFHLVKHLLSQNLQKLNFLCGEYDKFEDYWWENEELRAILMQCPQISDNGHVDSIGTKGRNKPDTINANREGQQGWLALHTIPDNQAE